MPTLLTEWVAGGFVIFDAVRRFGTPPINRASTTPGRYFVATGFYAFMTIVV